MKKLTIEEMRELAESRGGKCLSNIYVNARSKLTWRCANGHIWESVPYHISSNHWCPKCAIKRNASKRKLTLNDMQEIAIERNGEFLSTEYKGNNKKHKWKCGDCGNIWEAKPSNIKSHTWCLLCSTKRSHDVQRLTIEDMQQIALERGGECLSKIYKNTKTPLDWKCADGHIFKKSPVCIRSQNSWCPKCKKYWKEEKCRFILEQLTGKEFVKSRKLFPGFEIDGYCEELKLAFEYNGEQHYKNIKSFHRENDSLLKQKSRDRKVKRFCKESEIKLIVIPYKNANNDEQLEGYILNKLQKFEFEISSDKISWNKFYDNLSVLKYLSNIATKRNGKLISKTYNGSRSKLEWECEFGHKWESSPSNIKKGTWCPKCADAKKGDHNKLDISEMYELAIQRGGMCLSKEYINNQTKLQWKCYCGKIWWAVPGSIKMGTWCPRCAKTERLTIEDMKEIANKRNGKCLSDIYSGDSSKLKWKCSCGNIWEATPSNIKNGTWCPKCGEIKRRETTNGVCLDKNGKRYRAYININKKQITLGSYASKEHAKQIRKMAIYLYESGERDPEVYRELKRKFEKQC